MLFTKMVGQSRVKSDLINMALAGKVPHALLFLGPEGSGNLAAALAFAQFLLCDQPAAQDSCGECSNCSKASKLIHPDLHLGLHTQLQKMLLAKETRDLQPDVEFLESFAGVVGSLWPSLAVSLCLSESEIEEVKQLPQQHQALHMLQMWVSREDATYGQLCQRLKTVSLFQYT